MEPLIYGESPLADYLEGRASPDHITHQDVPQSPTSPFAPQVAHLRQQLQTLRRSATIATQAAEDRTLERFRYLIVASQLLSDDPKPRSNLVEQDEAITSTFTVRGAFVSAFLSFFAAWLASSITRRRRTWSEISWLEFCIYTSLVVGFTTFLAILARRRYIRFVQKACVSALSILVHEAHDVDGTVSSSLRLIQEVEVVARGYNMYVFL